MGRITIFTRASCGHCRRAKASLTARGFGYAEVSLSDYPARLADMTSLTQKSTVPQIFVNDTHLGGNDELNALIAVDPGRFDSDTNNALQHSDPSDVRLRLEDVTRGATTTPSISISDLLKLHETADENEKEKKNPSLIIGDRTYDHLGAIRWLRTALGGKIANRGEGFVVHGRCFRGSHLWRAIQSAARGIEKNDLRQENQITGECVRLLVSGTLRRVPHGSRDTTRGDTRAATREHTRGKQSENNPTTFSQTYLYRLQPDVDPGSVNSFRDLRPNSVAGSLGKTAPRGTEIKRVIDHSSLVSAAQRVMSMLEDRHSNVLDGRINRNTLRQDPDFVAFLDWFSETQNVSLTEIKAGKNGHATLAAFIINVYNLTVLVAQTTVGVSTSVWTRAAYFKETGVTFRDGFYSLDDLEHGLLRGNAGNVPYFGERDARRVNVVDWSQVGINTPGKTKPVECRVHFALNCGARGCPPISRFTGGDLLTELTTAARAFCEGDDHVFVENWNKKYGHLTVRLSRLFYWYKKDFGDDLELVRKLARWCPPGSEKQKRMNEFVANENGGAVAIKYAPYDWETNASVGSKSFSAKQVRRVWGRVTGL